MTAATVFVLHDAALCLPPCVKEGFGSARKSSVRPGKSGDPAKKRLKECCFCKRSSLPAYWLANVTAAEGYEWLD